jgi:hypothetical protein
VTKKQIRIKLTTARGLFHITARAGIAGRIISVENAGKAVNNASRGTILLILLSVESEGKSDLLYIFAF